MNTKRTNQRYRFFGFFTLLFGSILVFDSCKKVPALKSTDSTVLSTTTISTMDTITTYAGLKPYIGKEAYVEGVLLMKKFVDKRGREHEIYEFWLEMDGGNRVMVRNIGEAMSKEPFTHKVRMKALVFYGNIDSDSPEVQSRVGYRLDFTEVVIIKRL